MSGIEFLDDEALEAAREEERIETDNEAIVFGQFPAGQLNAISTITLLGATMYSGKRLIHLFVDNAPTTTPGWYRRGWRGRSAGSSCTSSPPTARTE
jgi:hypothetical protein